ncbi:hypothetical protein [Cellulomonas xiejunii]|uniref:Uncharacterized protein n=1 Tax=Cellulomonas xiejunii TaxID=2968083 RepID=A0ABY5KP68_9CELL|nr:hypothetical protein [Cellulomonas xiejunii]MCC2315504.1 hypothetical protein [Cellulomonas xiejunii]MCC2320668.1 hypothetical protein [Cellulomonas xiejunii]UUI70956.1 hypothetical protein NP048_14315 [Cellulomonas xiejunii]
MRSSSSDARTAAPVARGTWVRLAVLTLLLVLLALSSAVELTAALLTDTARTTTVVSTSLVFPTPAG